MRIEPRRLAPLLLALITLSGCIQHEVRVDPPPGGPPANAHVLVGFRPATPGSAVVRTSPLAIDLGISAWAVEEGVGVWRAELRVRSPTPWWQRFPCDIVADLMPIHAIARTQGTLAYRLITPQDRTTTPEALASEALAHGYAHPHIHQP
jgi:hypothetical protein